MTHTPGHRGGVSEGFDLTRHMERTRLSQSAYPELAESYDRATARGIAAAHQQFQATHGQDAAWRVSNNPDLRRYQEGVDWGTRYNQERGMTPFIAADEHAVADAYSGRKPIWQAMEGASLHGRTALSKMGEDRLMSRALQNIRDRHAVPGGQFSQDEVNRRAALAQAELDKGAAERRARPTYKKPLTPEQEARKQVRREKLEAQKERSRALRGYGPKRNEGESLYDYRQRTSPAAMARQAYIDQYTGQQQQAQDQARRQATWTGRSNYYRDKVKRYQTEYDAIDTRLDNLPLDMDPAERKAEIAKADARKRQLEAEMQKAHEFAASYEAGFDPFEGTGSPEAGEQGSGAPPPGAPSAPTADTAATPSKPSGPAQTAAYANDATQWPGAIKGELRRAQATNQEAIRAEDGRWVYTADTPHGPRAWDQSGKDVTNKYFNADLKPVGSAPSQTATATPVSLGAVPERAEAEMGPPLPPGKPLPFSYPTTPNAPTDLTKTVANVAPILASFAKSNVGELKKRLAQMMAQLSPDEVGIIDQFLQSLSSAPTPRPRGVKSR